MVNLSTARPGCDPACLISGAEHPFIRHDSYAAYAFARIEPVRRIEAGIASALFTPADDLTDTVFARVVRGITHSRFSRPEVLTYIQTRSLEC